VQGAAQDAVATSAFRKRVAAVRAAILERKDFLVRAQEADLAPSVLEPARLIYGKIG
jgi:hypothetical protein